MEDLLNFQIHIPSHDPIKQKQKQKLKNAIFNAKSSRINISTYNNPMVPNRYRTSNIITNIDKNINYTNTNSCINPPQKVGPTTKKPPRKNQTNNSDHETVLSEINTNKFNISNISVNLLVDIEKGGTILIKIKGIIKYLPK